MCTSAAHWEVYGFERAQGHETAVKASRMRPINSEADAMDMTACISHYPKYDDNVCSKLFQSQEQKQIQKLLSVGP